MGMASLNINLLLRRSLMTGSNTRKAVAAATMANSLRRSLTTGSNTPKAVAAAASKANSYICRSCFGPKAKSVLPSLMLPPSGDTVYDLYSLADDRVVSLNKTKDHPYELFKSSKDDDYDADAQLVVGSSHGWIVNYVNRHTPEGGTMFLSNPLSHQHVKLPKLPDHPEPLTRANVIISSPCPDEDLNCRAVMKYDFFGRLAFCCPASSNHWTPFGSKKFYCSSVYSARQKLFFCLTEDDGIEAWDLNDLNSPIMTPVNDLHIKDRRFQSFYPAHVVDDLRLWKGLYPSMLPESHCLAVAEKSDDLYQVHRFTTFACDIEQVPYKTLHFNVYKYDKELGEWEYMDGGLDGMALFVGINHGFALSAADYPDELKPDAIYFTDIHEFPDEEDIGGGHDIGIFNYRSNTFSPCYYPCDYPSINKVLPRPFWITLHHPFFPCNKL